MMMADLSGIARILAYFRAAIQDGATSVTEVMFSRLIGVALMNSPFRTTVWSLCAGRLNSDTPISLNSFLPAGAAGGMSFAAGALALLATGSEAFVTTQLFGLCSFRHPVTLTMSTLADGAACAMNAASSRAEMVIGCV